MKISGTKVNRVKVVWSEDEANELLAEEKDWERARSLLRKFLSMEDWTQEEIIWAQNAIKD